MEFDDIHSKHAHKLLQKYYVGELVEGEEEEAEEGKDVGTKVALPTIQHEGEPGPRMAGEEKGKERGEEAQLQPFLDPHDFKACPLIEKETVTHDTRRFRFGWVRGEINQSSECSILNHHSFNTHSCLFTVSPTPISRWACPSGATSTCGRRLEGRWCCGPTRPPPLRTSAARSTW